jgi:hypothetical protein
MSRWTASWNVIPDGTSSIVELEIKVETYVETAKATEHSEAIVVQLLSRLVELPEGEIRKAIDDQKWARLVEAFERPAASDIGREKA